MLTEKDVFRASCGINELGYPKASCMVQTLKLDINNPEQDPNIIAYAEMCSAESTDGYIPFSLELEYRELGRTPKYILIVISASKYGDFFTGGDGSTLWLDELELHYD